MVGSGSCGPGGLGGVGHGGLGCDGTRTELGNNASEATYLGDVYLKLEKLMQLYYKEIIKVLA